MKIFSLSICLLISIIAHAQITGTVVDEQNQPLPGASVAAYNQSEELVQGTTTGPDGGFSISLKPGTYELVVSFIAFEKYTHNLIVSSEKEKVNLGQISLEESSTALDEVTVEGRAKLMEFQQDKRVFNVSKDLTSVGSNASDILNNVPSVTVDIEGNVSLRGSQNVRILVNGKPSGLIGSDPATALRQLQASMIEKIEVITNPSARYDAEGEAGIINIVLKKEQSPGLNGTFEASAGYPDNYGASAGVNYRTGKFNWFTNGSIRYRRSPGGGFTRQTNNSADTTSYSYIDRDQSRGGLSGTLRLGADYNLTPSQTLTGSFIYQASRGNNFSTITYKDYDADSSLVSEVLRDDDELEEEQTFEGDLHWEKTFENKDHKWTADFKFQDEDDSEFSDIVQDTVFLRSGSAENTNNLLQRVQNQEDEQTILLQTDYVRPYSKTRRFELGAKATFRNIINNYEVSEKAPGGEFITLAPLTNEFQYLENIYAAYGIYSDAFGEDKKFTYQLGLRSEYSDIATIVGDTEPQNKEYINFFPSAFFTWKINVRSDLQLNYSRRLSRPHFRWLLPFSSFTDPRNFWTGNPDLDPEFTDSYEAGYVRYWEKATLYSGIYYRHRTGVVERITVEDSSSDGISYFSTFPINLAVQDAYGFEFNLTYDATDWYSLSANLNLFGAVTTGSYNEIDYGNENFTSQGTVMNRLKFWDSDLQLSFNYRGPQTTSQGRDLAIYSMDIGWSKDVLNGNGTITASVRDVFNSRRRRSYTSGPGWERYSEFQWRQRQFIVNFTYRLNQKKSRSGGGRGEGNFDAEEF